MTVVTSSRRRLNRKLHTQVAPRDQRRVILRELLVVIGILRVFVAIIVILHRVRYVTAPSFFPVVFTLLKPFLSEETKKKVHVLGRE